MSADVLSDEEIRALTVWETDEFVLGYGAGTAVAVAHGAGVP